MTAAALRLAACAKQPGEAPPAEAAEANATDTTPEDLGLESRLFGGGKPIAIAQLSSARFTGDIGR